MSHTRSSEAGFTLAGLIVALTVVAIFIAYTVPKQWSMVMARERDQQTIFAMKQYARAMRAFQQKNNAQPVSLDQLKEARSPRLLRGTKDGIIDPLTGKYDWIPVPMTQATANQAAQNAANPLGAGGGAGGGLSIGVGGTDRRGVGNAAVPQTGLSPAGGQPGQPGGMVGPMVGVRPNKVGTSYLSLNGMDTYEQWSYTTVDLEAEITQRRNAIFVK